MITTAKLINSALALVLTVVLAVPTKIGLDLLVWIGEAQLHFIRADAEGPATLFNFAAKISLW